MKLTIFKKQVLGFSVVLLLVVGVAVLNLVSTMKVRSDMNKVIDTQFAIYSEAEDLQINVLEGRVNGKQLLISGDTALTNVIGNLVNEAKGRAGKILELTASDAIKEAAQQIQLNCDQYLSDMRAVVMILQEESHKTGKSFTALLASDPLVKLQMNKWIADGNIMMAKGKEIVAYESKAVDSSTTEIHSTLKSTYLSVLVIALIAVVAGFGMAIVLARRFSNPIRVLNEAAKQVASGNNEAKVEIDSKDEIGELASAFNAMVENIKRAFVEAEKKGEIAEEAANGAKLANVHAESERHYLADCVDVMLLEINKLKEGDLTANLSCERDDDIKKLFDGFNQAVQTFRDMIREVAQTVETTASATTEISSSAEQLAAGSQEQSAQSNEVATAVEQMTRTIIGNSRNASKTAEVAMTNGALAKEGGEIVQKTVHKIREIANVVSKSATTVKKLGASSEQIGEIVLVINDIADQTNLLALNAAIEAARAGDQGRGFAVVADEVRKLAERTTQATKQIGDMIRTIQVETKDAVEAMKHGTDEVDDGIALADKAGEALQKIVVESKNLTDMINQIAAANEEQSSTSEQISKNVEAISSVSSEAAHGVSQIARAADDLNKLTENLHSLVLKFRIDNSTRPSGKNGNGAEDLTKLDFEDVKRAHKQWKIKLANCIMGKEKIDPKSAGAYRECKLGKWYYGKASKYLKGNTAFEELGKWHAELHQKAAEIASLCNENKAFEAESHLKSVEEASTHIVNLLDTVEHSSLATV